MTYNAGIIISLIICAIISLLVSYYGVLLILDESSELFKVAQLILVILLMTTFYAPIKYALLKYMDIDTINSEEKND